MHASALCVVVIAIRAMDPESEPLVAELTSPSEVDALTAEVMEQTSASEVDQSPPNGRGRGRGRGSRRGCVASSSSRPPKPQRASHKPRGRGKKNKNLAMAPAACLRTTWQHGGDLCFGRD